MAVFRGSQKTARTALCELLLEQQDLAVEVIRPIGARLPTAQHFPLASHHKFYARCTIFAALNNCPALQASCVTGLSRHKWLSGFTVNVAFGAYVRAWAKRSRSNRSYPPCSKSQANYGEYSPQEIACLVPGCLKNESRQTFFSSWEH